MSSDLRIGLIGLDTSHVIEFAKAMTDSSHAGHVREARIVAGFPGGSDDFELSRSRVEGFTQQLRDQYSVTILDAPEAVAESCDVVFITSVDGRVHLEQFRRILK